ncbi:MAG: hypothetical protein RIT27_2405 [Pseudomonadota bacterium]|jgi:protein TonB
MKLDLFYDLTTAVGSISVGLFFSLTLHSLLLTTTFEHKPSYQVDTKLDIVLVQTKTDKKPQDAKFIGQANQDGGGIETEEQRAKTPVLAPFHSFETNVVTTPLPPQQAAHVQSEQLQQITVKESTLQIQQQTRKEDVDTTLKTTGEDLQTTPDLPLNESEFIKNARTTIASVQTDIDEEYREFKNRPPHKIIGAKTKEVHHAKYMNEWIKKVERIAIAHKPPKELKKKLKGTLIVKVSFRSDGTLYGIEILQSSKNSFLDEYTLQVARLSTPFKPFEKDQKIMDELGKNGILEIVRTWKWNLSPTVSNTHEQNTLKVE